MQSTDSVQSLTNYQWHFSKNVNKKFYNVCGNKKRLQIAKVILRKENRPGGASPQLQTILQSYSKQDSMVLT